MTEDLTPGAGDSRFRDVDPDHDYSDTSGWSSKPAEAEAVLEAIRDEATATTAGDEATVESRIEPAGRSREPKRHVLREPTEESAVETVVGALLAADHYALVELLVHEPEMTRQRWDSEYTALERVRLWSDCCAFIRADEFVDMATLEAAENELRDADGPG